MSNLNLTKLLLGIEDNSIQIKNIETFTEVKTVKVRGVEQEFIISVDIVSASLCNDINHCPNCGKDEYFEGKKMIVKNGSKISNILMCATSVRKVKLHLKKQRFHCKHCLTFFTCETNVVARHCFISKQVKFKILECLSEKRPASRIAKANHVSWSTVQRIIQSLSSLINNKKNWLPSCLMVDEFCFKKKSSDKFAFICVDGDTGKLFDILPSRRLSELKNYFNSFTREARKMVKYIVTDMNAPYIELATSCFPNAQFIVDRFHIVQHANKHFDKTRINVMKSLNRNDSVQSSQYNQLKSLNKLLLKNCINLDTSDYRGRRNFKWTQLCEKDMVFRMLSISEVLKTDYNFFQDLLFHFRKGNVDEFFRLTKNMPKNISNELKHIKSAFLKYEKGIELAMTLSYSNGKIENMNTHIKALKRSCYGFTNFNHFRNRIFLMNGLLGF